MEKISSKQDQSKIILEDFTCGERGTKNVKVVGQAVRANDLDEGKNGEVHYWLEDNLGMFTIDRRTGWVFTHSELDHEKKTEYVLNVVAFDNGNPALNDRATINVKILDANDNPPKFARSSWNISVPEDCSVGSFLIELETVDADEKSERLEFFIISGDKDCKFVINAQGKMFLMKKLDREETSQFIVTVLATDGKFSTLADIVIHVLDVNDEKPQCVKEAYFVQLSEDVPKFTYVTTIEAFDPDSEPNYYFFLPQENANLFTINNSTGELRTSSLLDRETTDHHSITVYVGDKTMESWSCKSIVSVRLMDVNDCPPKFYPKNITASIVENAPIGSVVIMLHAVDPDLASNAKVRYSLVGGPKDYFKINPKSGLVQLMKSVDREEKDSYVLTVRASDETAPQLFSDANLIITVSDVNDNPPIFSQKVYHSQVSESAPEHTQFMKLEAYSADIGANAEIFFSILGGDEENNFFLDPSTGVMSVGKPLDYEKTKNYILTVEARDLGEPPLSTQALVNISVIDSNDNTPIFLQTVYTTVVPEDISLGNAILQVIASDADSGRNGRIIYSIEKGDTSNQFTVDPISGYVTVTAPLDREFKDLYKLLIKATDGGSTPLSSTASIVIEISDANDNPPKFTSSNYSAFIQEGKRAGWSIVKLVVHDADLEMNGPPFEFDIQSGNEKNLFTIGADGIVRTRVVLSGLLHKVYHLQIRVYDSGTPPLYSDTVVTIKVTEESQHPPVVSPLNVVVISYESQLRSCNLGTVHARDIDPYDTHAFKLEGEPNGFFIDPMSGVLSMNDLDPGVYYFNVTVTDGKFTSSAIISVSIQSIFRNMLLSAFSMRFKGMSPKYFLLTGWKTILRLLKKLLKTDILLLSIQPVNRDLDVLLSFQEYISIEELNKVVSETMLAAVLLKCNCQNGGKCKQSVTIVPHRVGVTSTETESFVAAEHTHFLYCACSPAYSGEFCEEEACECPPPTLCSHQGGTMVCTSPPPVAPLCADNRTCDSADGSHYSFVYHFVVIIFLATILLSAFTVIAFILWRRKRDRSRNRDDSKNRKTGFRVDSQNCAPKITNLKASLGGRPSSYNNGNDSLFPTLPLNNLENPRNLGLDEHESISCDYLQNINPDSKMRKVENGDALESPKAFEMVSYGFPLPNEVHGIPRLDDH